MTRHYCKYLNNSICFNEDKILFCTIGNDAQSRRLPIVEEDFDGNLERFEEALEKINRYKEELKSGIVPKFCDRCIQIREIEDRENNESRGEEFKYVLFSNWYKCNSKCIYCQKPIRGGKYIDTNREPVYNIIPIIKLMIERKMITENSIIDFAGAGGEPTLYEYFDEAINLLLKSSVRKIIVHTNAIKYNENIAKGIEKGIMDISVSVDSGSKKVYEKLKRVDTYDKVWENIKRYAIVKSPLTDNEIICKYIIIPGYNDTQQEITRWLKKSKEAGVSKLVLNADDRIFQSEEKDSFVLMKIISLTEFFTKMAIKNCYKYELFYGTYLPYIMFIPNYRQYVPRENRL